MGRIRLSRQTRGRIGYTLGAVLVTVGVYLLHGLGWSFIVAGLLLGGYALALYDVDEPERPVQLSTRPPGHPLREWSDAP